MPGGGSAQGAGDYERPARDLEGGGGEGAETLDLVRIGADCSPHWLRTWPTAEENPRHAGLELCMTVHGHRIVDKPASWFDTCED